MPNIERSRNTGSIPRETNPNYNPYETNTRYNPYETNPGDFQQGLLMRNEEYNNVRFDDGSTLAGDDRRSFDGGSTLVGGDEARFQDPAAANRQRIIETLHQLGIQADDERYPMPETEIRNTIEEGRQIFPSNHPIRAAFNDIERMLNDRSGAYEAPRTPGAYETAVRGWQRWVTNTFSSSSSTRPENRGAVSSQSRRPRARQDGRTGMRWR